LDPNIPKGTLIKISTTPLNTSMNCPLQQNKRLKLKIHRRHFFAYTGTALALTVAAKSVSAWPAHPLEIIVCFPPGRSSDIATCIVAKELSQVLGQPMPIENKPGTGATLAHELVAKAPALGQTPIATLIAKNDTGISSKTTPSIFKDFQTQAFPDHRLIS
jgi:tripartite-type tricarboxylate transporter receptor subunit TctC